MMQMTIIQMMERMMPASKKGMGMIKGPTPKSRLTEVKRAVYFCFMLILILLLYASGDIWLIHDVIVILDVYKSMELAVQLPLRFRFPTT